MATKKNGGQGRDDDDDDTKLPSKRNDAASSPPGFTPGIMVGDKRQSYDTGGKATNTVWKPDSLKAISDATMSPRADHLGGARRGPADKKTGRMQ